MKIKFDEAQTARIPVNVVSIYLTLLIPAQNSRSGQDAYFTHTAATGLDYVSASRKLIEIKKMVAAWNKGGTQEIEGLDYRIDLHKSVMNVEITRCWYCDNGPRNWDMDCDGAYQTSTCNRCTSYPKDEAGDLATFGHFGCNQRDEQYAREHAKYNMPCPSWYDEDKFVRFLGHNSYRSI